MELVTVKTYDNLIEAHLMTAKLESEGVQSYLFDAEIVGLNPIYSAAVGGIKVKVNQQDLEKVKLIYKELEEKPYTDDNNQVVACPNCESTSIIPGFKTFKSVKGVLAIIASFLFVLYPPYYKTVYKCRDCAHEFHS